MNTDELIRTKRQLTIEEFRHLEAEALRWARELYAEADKICQRANQAGDRELATKMRASVTNLVENLELAIACPCEPDDDEALAELKGLLKDLEKIKRQAGLPSSGRRKGLRFWRRN
jgi:hypothetical protein